MNSWLRWQPGKRTLSTTDRDEQHQLEKGKETAQDEVTALAA
jgi:hypothetical protein